jgi:hypothetical protein
VHFFAICNVHFSSVDPEFWPAVEALKKAKAAPAEIVGSCQQVKPSRKAKRAAGINTSDEESSNHDSNNQANTDSKRKVGKNKDNSAGKKKSKEAPKKNCPCKKVHVDSNDADLDSLGENDEDGGDEADAYKKLQLEREKDQPVPYK